MNCYCGLDKPYSECCQPIHQDPKQATTPEQLMRARYCAHLTWNIKFIIKTYHPSCHAESYRQGIQKTINLKWMRLKVSQCT